MLGPGNKSIARELAFVLFVRFCSIHRFGVRIRPLSISVNPRNQRSKLRTPTLLRSSSVLIVIPVASAEWEGRMSGVPRGRGVVMTLEDRPGHQTDEQDDSE